MALRHDPAPATVATASKARGRAGRPTADLSGVELELFEALRRWRKQTSDEQGVPPYVIFHDATLRQVAELRPRNRAALAGVSGIGTTKLERHGQAVLAVLDEVLGPADGGASGAGASGAVAGVAAASRTTGAVAAPPAVAGLFEAPVDPSDRWPGGSAYGSPDESSDGLADGWPDGSADGSPAGLRYGSADDEGLDSVEETLGLLLDGYAPEAVANMRKLKVRTVEGHMAELVRRGDLTVEEATGLSREQIRQVEETVEALPADQRRRLRPLYDALGGRLDYALLKCVVAGMDR